MISLSVCGWLSPRGQDGIFMTTQTLKVLTAAQAEKFWKDGYLVLPAFLSDGDVSALRDSLAVLDDWVQAHSHPDFTHEPDSRDLERTVIRKITNIHVHGGAPWRELMERSDVLDLFEDLIGPDIAFHHSKAMMKPPHEGSAKPWHQDLPEGFISPDEADRLRPLGNGLQPEHVPVVAIQYYVDDSTLENGCIQVVPGSHRRGLFEDPLDESLIDPAEVVAAEVPAGGALLFHCLTYHYSAPNTSPNWRRGMVFEYMAPTVGVNLYDSGAGNLEWGTPLRGS